MMQRTLLAVVFVLGVLVAAHDTVADVDGGNGKADDLRLTSEKMSREIEKLKFETEALREAGTRAWQITRISTTWLAAALPMVVVLAGVFVNRNQRARLKQEREVANEKHLLEVCQSLGDKSDRVRLGAISVLIGRLDRLAKEERLAHPRRTTAKRQTSEKRKTPEKRKTSEANDIQFIIRIVINATKSEPSRVLQKYVADGLASALDAIVPRDVQEPTGSSPLAPFDFQGAKFTNAWWKRVDARGVDFYRACLCGAGLRSAFLQDAVLKFADLRGATLVDANLQRADLSNACLQGAKMERARLEGANLTGANLTGADLTGADLTGAELRGADLIGAIMSEELRARARELGAKVDRDLASPTA